MHKGRSPTDLGNAQQSLLNQIILFYGLPMQLPLGNNTTITISKKHHRVGKKKQKLLTANVMYGKKSKNPIIVIDSNIRAYFRLDVEFRRCSILDFLCIKKTLIYHYHVSGLQGHMSEQK